MNIICQCDYGESRSAGCAAAILEYFYKKGITVFYDYGYYPNQVIFHKIYDALVRINPIYCDSWHSQNIRENTQDLTTGVGVLHAKNRIEKELKEQGKCYHSLEEAYYQLRHGRAKVYVSLHIDDATVCHGKSMGEHNVGVKSFFRYTDKDVPLMNPIFSSK